MTSRSPDRIEQTSYQFTDRSFIRPAVTRWWFARLFPLLPRWLAANLVTLFSTGALLVVLGLSLDPARWPPTILAITFTIALQVYVAGDHLDGMQAKASGTASPLGDFLDHFCDLWAGCILVFGFWSLLGDASRLLLNVMLALLILCFATTFAEREERRRLHFTSVGTLEIIAIFTAFLISWIVPGARTWWHSEMVAGLPWYSLLVATGIGVASGTIVVIMRRMGRLPGPTVAFTIALASLVAVVSFRTELRPIEGWLLIVSFGATYVARVMHGYLVKGSRSRPDPLGTFALIGLALWVTVFTPTTDAVRTVCVMIGVYQTAVLAVTLGRIFRSLRRYWVWVNAANTANAATT